jgi:molecular chaperone DnaK
MTPIDRQERTSVTFRSLKGREIVVSTRESPPSFGDVVELRNPTQEDVKAVVGGEVVGLERDYSEPGAIRVSLRLDLDAAEAIAQLFPTERRAERHEGHLAGSPLFASFDEEEKKHRKKRRSDQPIEPPKIQAATFKDASDLSWGWVADDEAALAAGNIRATPAGTIDVDALSNALAGKSVESTSDFYSKLTDLWSPPPAESPPRAEPLPPPDGASDRGSPDERAVDTGTVEPAGELEAPGRDAARSSPPAVRKAKSSPPGGRAARSSSPAVRAAKSSSAAVRAAKSSSAALRAAKSSPPAGRAAKSSAPPASSREGGGSQARRSRRSLLSPPDSPSAPDASSRRGPRPPSSEPRTPAEASNVAASKAARAAPSDAGRYTATPHEDETASQAVDLGSKRRASTDDDDAIPTRGIAGGYRYTSDSTVPRHRRSSPPDEDQSQPRRSESKEPAAQPSRPRAGRGARKGLGIVEHTGPERRVLRRSPAKGADRDGTQPRARGSKRRSETSELLEAPALGIDFGATSSKVAVFDGELVLIEDLAAATATRAAVPSVVALDPDGEWIVGERARALLAVDRSRVITGVKRLMGLTYSDPQASGVLASLSAQARPGPDDDIFFDVDGQYLSVVDVVTRVIKHLVEMAFGWAGRELTRAVLTVPVDFGAAARKDLEVAARRAGLEVVAVVSEPVAAAMGCGFTGEKDSIVAVVDFGGGTCDVSIVKVSNDRFAVLGTAGDRWLGGMDLDELLARHVAGVLAAESGWTFGDRPEVHQRFLFACEEAKRRLSSLERVDLIVAGYPGLEERQRAFNVSVARSQFEALIDDSIAAELEVCERATQAAGISAKDVTSLLVTGGTTRVPAVREAAELFFGRPAVAGVHPEHAVVSGAAVHGALISNVKVPENFGAFLRGIGTVSRQIGLALADGTTEPVIEASRRPPVAAHRLFCTSQDDQTACRIELVEGDDPKTSGNRKLGGFVIDGLPKRKAGETKLDIFFELNSSGSLCVTAQDRASGHRAAGIFAVPVS